MITYEQRLDSDTRWALREGSMHFEKESAVHRTLERVVRRLDEIGVPYAVAGGMALFVHGFRRFTEDVAILVTRDGLRKIHEELEGRGYVPPFTGSKNLRDADTGVRIEFLVSGEYPSDGKPKPVAFPPPEEAAVSIDGVRYVGLPRLIEMKLASGMTNSLRLQDIVDVQKLIAVLKLPASFAEQPDPFIRDRFNELWALLQSHPER
jgi:hypothetical protein